MKFRIFKQPLCMSLKNVKKIVLASMMLHNFVINARLEQCDLIDLPDEAQEIGEPVRKVRDFTIRASKLKTPFHRFKNIKGKKLANDEPATRPRWHPWGHPDYDLDVVLDPQHDGTDEAVRDAYVQFLDNNKYLRPNMG